VVSRSAPIALAPWARAWEWLLIVASSMSLGCIQWSMPQYTPPEIAMPPIYPMALAPAPVVIQNPLMIPGIDRDYLWNQLVDVIDDYYKISREQRVRLVGDVQTEGLLDTYPRPSPTYFEPWEPGTATRFDRLEATLQSIRRHATVRVIPTEGGYMVDLAIYKELEDVPKPENLFASRFNLRNDDSLHRLSTPVGGEEPTTGWIPQGRDTALEQKIIAQLQERLANPPRPF
jgi:hypothetical protein